jgi:hypothetical protein
MKQPTNTAKSERKRQNTTREENMKTAKRITNVLALTMAVIGMTIGSARAEVIYSDDFSGGSGTDLNGTTPDVTTGGATWTAAAVYKADGSFANGGVLTLPFTPVDGLIYTLDVSIHFTSGNNWSPIGFGRSSTLRAAYHQIRQPGGGTHRAPKASSPNTNIEYPDVPAGLKVAHPLDVRIVLDTNGDAGKGTVTFYAKLPAALDYTYLPGPLVITASDITHVGLEAQGSAVGSITSFSLSDNADPAVLLDGSDTSGSVVANAPPGSVVGALTMQASTGPYTFTELTDSKDAFAIIDDKLRTTKFLDDPPYTVEIKGEGSATASNTFTITLNAATYTAFVASAGVNSGTPVGGEVVATLEARDGDDGSLIGTFGIVGGRDDLFQIIGNELQQKAGADPGAPATVHYVTLFADGVVDGFVIVAIEVGAPPGTVIRFR